MDAFALTDEDLERMMAHKRARLEIIRYHGRLDIDCPWCGKRIMTENGMGMHFLEFHEEDFL